MVFNLADIPSRLLLSAIKKVHFLEHYRLRKSCKGLNNLIETQKFKIFGSELNLGIVLAANVEDVSEMYFGNNCITQDFTAIARDLHRIHFGRVHLSAHYEDDDLSEKKENQIVKKQHIKTVVQSLSPSCDVLDILLGIDSEEDIQVLSLITCRTLKIYGFESELLNFLPETYTDIMIEQLDGISPSFNAITKFRLFSRCSPKMDRDNLRSFLLEGMAAKSFNNLEEYSLFCRGDIGFLANVDIPSLRDIFISGSYINGWFQGGRVYQLPFNDKESLLLKVEKVCNGIFALHCFVCADLEQVVLKVMETFEPKDYFSKPFPRDYSSYYEALSASTPSQYCEITETFVKGLARGPHWK